MIRYPDRQYGMTQVLYHNLFIISSDTNSSNTCNDQEYSDDMELIKDWQTKKIDLKPNRLDMICRPDRQYAAT